MMQHQDPVLSTYLRALQHLEGDRLVRAVLFGSRARGDARADSDYDIAVFLKNFSNRWDEKDKLLEIETAIILETGAVINSKPFPEGAENERTPLMHEIRLEGIDLCRPK
jgi:predicted nucleotidyltransferase